MAGELVRVKRVHAIAQPQTAPNTYPRTGSFIQFVGWNAGQVRDANGNWGNWLAGFTNENGSNPLNNAIVSWTTIAPFAAEINIIIDRR